MGRAVHPDGVEPGIGEHDFQRRTRCGIVLKDRVDIFANGTHCGHHRYLLNRIRPGSDHIFATPLAALSAAPRDLPARRLPLLSTCGRTRGFTLSLWSLYSTESTSACQLASTTLLESPTVPQRRRPSVDSISTRTRAPVPAPLSSTRTL